MMKRTPDNPIQIMHASVGVPVSVATILPPNTLQSTQELN